MPATDSIVHTGKKSRYAVIIGRTVQFFARPALTRQKGYREPVLVEKKSYPSKADATAAANIWEGRLV